MPNAITPFSVLSWWQKKKFQWLFRDPQYLFLLKTVRRKLRFGNMYVCLLLDNSGKHINFDTSVLCAHISQVQGVDTYGRWMECNNMVVSETATHWGRKAWVDQMIKALEG